MGAQAYEIARHGHYFAVHQNEDSLVFHRDQIPALCRALHEAAGLVWPERVQHHQTAADGNDKHEQDQLVERAHPGGGGIYPAAPDTTPDEDRDWVPEVMDMGLKSRNLKPEEARIMDIPMPPVLPPREPTPDLTALKAALEGLRASDLLGWRSRHSDHPVLQANPHHHLFLAAERAGLLTEERPADPVEVAREALERIAAEGAPVTGLAMAKSIARTALAALRQGSNRP